MQKLNRSRKLAPLAFLAVVIGGPGLFAQVIEIPPQIAANQSGDISNAPKFQRLFQNPGYRIFLSEFPTNGESAGLIAPGDMLLYVISGKGKVSRLSNKHPQKSVPTAKGNSQIGDLEISEAHLWLVPSGVWKPQLRSLEGKKPLMGLAIQAPPWPSGPQKNRKLSSAKNLSIDLHRIAGELESSSQESFSRKYLLGTPRIGAWLLVLRGTLPAQRHPNDTLFYIYRGKVAGMVNGRPITADMNKLIRIPAGAEYSLQINTPADKPAVLIQINIILQVAKTLSGN